MDDLLKQLGHWPIPKGLGDIEGAVIAGLHERRAEARATSRILSMAAVFALMFGFFGASVVAPSPAPERAVGLATTTLAPSTLLDFL